MSSTSPSSTPAETQTAKRKHRNVTRACAHCRSRKSKCDGVRPACGHCQSIHAQCEYDMHTDGRRVFPKSVTDALQLRVSALEALLTARNIPIDEVELLNMIDKDMGKDVNEDGQADLRRHKSWERLKNMDPQLPLGDEELNFGIDRLKLDDGELRQVGPSACFHMPWTAPAPELLQSYDGRSYITMNPSNRTSRDLGGINGLCQSATSQTQTNVPSPPTYPDPETSQPSPWSKHLPNIPGFSMAAHDESLGLFFLHNASWIVMLEQKDFEQDMRSCLSTNNPQMWRKSYYSPLLHNAILANAVGLLKDPSLNTIAIRDQFANQAVNQVHSEMQRPMISTIYGLVFLARFYGSSSPSELGYMYSGLALRCSQSLGLGIDCSAFVRKGTITAEVKAQRDHAFYVCFVLDKLWSFHAGRAAVLTMPVHQISMPAAPSASLMDDLSPWGYPDRPFDVNLADRDNRSWRSTTFRELVKLCHIAERILKTVYSVHLNLSSIQVGSIVSEINLLMETWYSFLPKPLRITPQTKTIPPPHVLNLNLVYHYLVIMLYRPFDNERHTQWGESASQRCSRASSRIVHILQMYATSPGLKYASDFVIHITFAAASVQLSQFQKSHSSSRSLPVELDSSVKHCIEALLSIASTWPLAKQFADKLQTTLGSMSQSSTLSTGRSGARQMLADRPELADELRAMGWIPPVETTDMTWLDISQSNQTVATQSTWNTSSLHSNLDILAPPAETEQDWSLGQEDTMSLDPASLDFIYSLLHER